jgi:uncharacterized protein YjdB
MTTSGMILMVEPKGDYLENLSAIITPTNASTPNLIWRSGDVSIASVSNSGRVTGLGKGGIVTTYAQAQDGSNVTGSKKITVTFPQPPMLSKGLRLARATVILSKSMEMTLHIISTDTGWTVLLVIQAK